MLLPMPNRVNGPTAALPKKDLRLPVNAAAGLTQMAPTSGPSHATQPARLVIGISGASGVVFGVRLLELLRGTMIETHLVLSRSAEVTLAYETDYKVKDVKALADRCYGIDD